MPQVFPKSMRVSSGSIFSTSSSFRFAAFVALALACLVGAWVSSNAQVAGPNVNMVSGTQWPTGDPFLQRQNEPSMAVSTRNPLHILAGANDYRTVDLEQDLTNETGDAWLGLFSSFDGGLTWQSTLLPGCPVPIAPCNDPSPLNPSPLYGKYQAAADPVVRAGTNGMFYYAGLAFNRGAGGLSSVFVSRLMDLNNQENGDPIAFIDTQIVATGNGSQFLDKPAMAVDIPRSGATTCSFTLPGPNNTTISQSFRGGNIFLTYTDFLAKSKDNATPTRLMFTRSTDCGQTWSTTPIQLNTGTTTSQGSAIAVNPANGNVFVAWRQFGSTGIPDAIMIAQSTNAGKTFRSPVRISTFTPFDQGTTDTSFRTNAYPSIAVDGFGIAYVAFSARGIGAGGDARIVVTGSIDGTHWLPPIPVDNPGQNSATNPSGRGHQIMPAISFANGRLTLLYYDLRLDHYADFFNPNPSEPGQYIPTLVPEGELNFSSGINEVFTQYIDDSSVPLRRHTIDLRVLQLGLFPTPAFGPSVLVSQYAYGSSDGSNIEQFKFNPPNLPLFGQGTEPFLGDYIDIVPSPQFVPSGNSWTFNLTPSANPTFHAAWTDNRDVVPPLDGHWDHYTPPVSASLGSPSLFDPPYSPLPCQIGQEGMRNQNIYTAQITGGLIVGAPGNAKPLGTTTNPFTKQTVLLQRAFPVEAQNLTNVQKYFRFAIQNQPAGGMASFLQFSKLTTLDLTVPALSSVSRSVFVTSTNAQATITVSVTEINQVGGSPVNNGLTASTVLNPDITNPSITNPSITNPSIKNPDITNSEVTNPSITNPSITNPSTANPSITNPDITNPSITNPSITNQSAENPSITNPSITNPDITNPSITNPSITNPDITNNPPSDVTYPITNNGNTTSTYTVKLGYTAVPPHGIVLQLIVNRPYETPAVSNNCQLTTENHWVTVANIVNPKLTSMSDSSLGNPDITNSAPDEASVTLAPGETADITIRLVNPSPLTIPFTANTLISTIFPATVPHAVNTQTVFQNGGSPSYPPLALFITTPSLPAAMNGTAYSQPLQFVGGVSGANNSWSIVSGSLPPGIGLNSATGLISGTATKGGSFPVTIQLKDSASPPDVTTASYTLVVSAPLTITTTTLPEAADVDPYPFPGGSAQITATGGNSGPLTYSVITGALPSSVALNPATGVLSSSKVTDNPGNYNFTVQVQDSGQPQHTATKALTLTVVPLFVGTTPNTIPAGTVGTPYSQNLTSTATTPSYTYALDPHSTPLPPGLGISTLNPTTGLLSGTPTTPGTYSFTIDATDSSTTSPNPQQYSEFIAVTINSAVVLPPAGAMFAVTGTPSTPTTAGQTFSATAQLGDGNQNPIPLAGVSVTVSLSSALCSSAVLSGTLTQTTDITGKATFNDLSINRGGNDYNLTATASAAPVVTGQTNLVTNVGFCQTVGNMSDSRSAAASTFVDPNPVGQMGMQDTGIILVSGGIDGSSNTSISKTADLYNPSTGTFTQTGSMATARTGHTLTAIGNNMALAAGGYDDSSDGGLMTDTTTTAEIYTYNSTTGSFAATGRMITPRYGHTATLLNNGMVLIAGGISTTNTYNPQTQTGFVNDVAVNVAELYDPSSGTFIPITAPMTSARSYDTATLLPNGSVLLAGGSSVVFGENPLATAEVFTLNPSNPSASTFTATANNMSQARDSATANLTSYFNGQITVTNVLVAGGSNSNVYPTGWDNTADLYVPGTNSFTPTGSLSDARYSAVAVEQVDGSVLVASGYALTPGSPGFGAVNNAELYNMSSGMFQMQPLMVVARQQATAVGVFGGTSLSYGGIIVIMGGDANGTAEVYFSGVSLSGAPPPHL